MTASLDPEVPTEATLDEVLEAQCLLIREQIIFALRVYKSLQPSMLHVALGTATPADLWKRILRELINEGVVQSTEVQLTSPRDRRQTYTILHLATNPYTLDPALTIATNPYNTASEASAAETKTTPISNAA